jgi:hypothetical protein
VVQLTSRQAQEAGKAVSSTIPRCRKPKRRRVRAGAPDRALTGNTGLAAVAELCDRLSSVKELDAAVGPIKQRDRGFGPGELLTGLAAAQLAGEDFLLGPDRQRADAAGQPGLAATTAADLARRLTPVQWQAAEAGVAAVTGRTPPPRNDQPPRLRPWSGANSLLGMTGLVIPRGGLMPEIANELAGLWFARCGGPPWLWLSSTPGIPSSAAGRRRVRKESGEYARR